MNSNPNTNVHTISLKTKPSTIRLRRPMVTAATPPVRRLLTTSAIMFITDDEWFTDNQHGTAQKTSSVVLTQDLPSSILPLEGYAGGEVRVELNLVARALSNGDVIVEGNVRLYEGTSTSTNDLDGEKTFQLLVPRNKFQSAQVNIWNSDEGGDHAEIFLNFSNAPA